LYQNACYLFEKKDEDIFMFLKDISRFENRDLARSVILDPKPFNFIMTPDNGMPVMEYNAEMDGEDPFLLALIDDLEELR